MGKKPQVYLYYKENKSVSELNWIGSFKLYKAFFRLILFSCMRFVCLDNRLFYMSDNHKTPKNEEYDPLKKPCYSSEERLTRYVEYQRLLYNEKNTITTD